MVVVALPLFPPEQFTAVVLMGDDGVAGPSGGGSATVTGTVLLQPFASVTVTEYVPAVRPVAVALFPPVGLHKYEYGPVPLATVMDAVPSLPVKQETAVEVGMLVTRGAGIVIF